MFLQGIETPGREMRSRMLRLGVVIVHEGLVGVGNPWHPTGLPYVDLEVPANVRVRYIPGTARDLGTLLSVSRRTKGRCRDRWRRRHRQYWRRRQG